MCCVLCASICVCVSENLPRFSLFRPHTCTYERGVHFLSRKRKRTRAKQINNPVVRDRVWENFILFSATENSPLFRDSTSVLTPPNANCTSHFCASCNINREYYLSSLFVYTRRWTLHVLNCTLWYLSKWKWK